MLGGFGGFGEFIVRAGIEFFSRRAKILIARMETGKKIHQLRGNCRPRSIRPNLRRVGNGAGEGGAPGVTQARRRQISQRFQYPTQPNYP
jgi:hypothetical protein